MKVYPRIATLLACYASSFETKDVSFVFSSILETLKKYQEVVILAENPFLRECALFLLKSNFQGTLTIIASSLNQDMDMRSFLRVVHTDHRVTIRYSIADYSPESLSMANVTTMIILELFGLDSHICANSFLGAKKPEITEIIVIRFTHINGFNRLPWESLYSLFNETLRYPITFITY